MFAVCRLIMEFWMHWPIYTLYIEQFQGSATSMSRYFKHVCYCRRITFGSTHYCFVCTVDFPCDMQAKNRGYGAVNHNYI